MTEAEQPQDPRLRLELAIAVARERLAETHLAQALDFVRHLAGQVSGARTLTMYARLHHLPDEQHRALVNAVLAAFGRHDARPGRAARPAEVEIEWTDTSTVLERAFRRLRGRRNQELRHWVERHTGHAERLLLDVHVQNALRYLEARGTDTDIAVGVYAYMQALSVRESLFEALHILVLDRLHHQSVMVEAAPEIAAARAGLRVVGEGG
jgi:hypothetical protein